MLVPFGLSFKTKTSAPSSFSTSGLTLYAAPFAQSMTTFIPSRVMPLGKPLLTDSIYRPTASSILKALPTSWAVDVCSISPEVISSMRHSRRPQLGRLSKRTLSRCPRRLCEAEITTPASALRLLV
jgi:hypothetical protein